ncbi:DUF2490 domain-containing protein [Sphingomonas gellani]|uniref:DUF2490 domain-containing protein n=1 Tax=Sphingomonas gellani TaxID=1166340 RepID=UPI001FCCE649|nr:DUF2490 domain-containing protein [Sphingomonas gellani]
MAGAADPVKPAPFRGNAESDIAAPAMLPAARSLSALALTAALFLLCATPARAQQQDEQLWLQVNTIVPLATDARVTLEQIARFSDRQDGLYQTEFGGLLEYRVAKGVQLGFGYRDVGAHNGNTADGEDRLRQQVVATFGAFTTRLRVDERFSRGASDTAFRIRPLIRYNHRLNPHGLALFVSHESFILPNSTSWGQRRGYERMRNVVGLMLPVAPTVSADVGYLNQYRPARGGARGQMDHALSLQLTINLAAHPVAPTHD